MRVMPDDQISAGIDCGMTYFFLIHREHGGNEMNAPVHGNDHDIRRGFGLGDVIHHRRDIILVCDGDYFRRMPWRRARVAADGSRYFSAAWHSHNLCRATLRRNGRGENGGVSQVLLRISLPLHHGN